MAFQMQEIVEELFASHHTETVIEDQSINSIFEI
jgi:hypothetical protein